MSSRRARGRGNARGGRQQNVRNQQMDSNGPGGRIRGTPQQVLDRYLALARDASSAGDSMLAENLYQHAEHYSRLLSAATPPQQQNQQNQGNSRDDQSYDDADGDGDGDGNQADQGGNAQQDRQQDRQQQDRQQQDRQPQDRPQRGRPRRSAAADTETAEPTREATEQPDAPAEAPEWTAGDQQPDGEQPAGPPRRRRRSRFQRQQDQEGGDNAAPQASDTSNDANGTGNGADSNPVPPIDLSKAPSEPVAPEPVSSEPAPKEKPVEPGEQSLV